jgi:protein-S-isoprenylcysteine O-methyltransferase Ste14
MSMSGSHHDGRPDHAGVIAPPPLIALAALVIGVAADWLLPIGWLGSLAAWWVRAAVGAIPFAAGIAMAVAAERVFRRIGTNVPPWEPTLRLATDGIYRWLRNPMYVGVILMLAGFAIAIASDWLLILLVPTALLLHFGVVLREERYLEAKFGEEYRRYASRVPRYGWLV